MAEIEGGLTGLDLPQSNKYRFITQEVSECYRAAQMCNPSPKYEAKGYAHTPGNRFLDIP